MTKYQFILFRNVDLLFCVTSSCSLQNQTRRVKLNMETRDQHLCIMLEIEGDDSTSVLASIDAKFG